MCNSYKKKKAKSCGQKIAKIYTGIILSCLPSHVFITASHIGLCCSIYFIVLSIERRASWSAKPTVRKEEMLSSHICFLLSIWNYKGLVLTVSSHILLRLDLYSVQNWITLYPCKSKFQSYTNVESFIKYVESCRNVLKKSYLELYFLKCLTKD